MMSGISLFLATYFWHYEFLLKRSTFPHSSTVLELTCSLLALNIMGKLRLPLFTELEAHKSTTNITDSF